MSLFVPSIIILFPLCAAIIETCDDLLHIMYIPCTNGKN